MGKFVLKAYIGAVGALSLALVASWAYSFGIEAELRYAVGAAIFGLLIVLAELFPIRLSEHSEINALDIALVAAVVTLGPFWATLATLPGAVVTGRKDLLRTAYEASRRTAEAFLAGMVFSFAAPPLLSSGGSVPTATAVYATLAAAVTLILTNDALSAGLLKVKYGQTLGQIWEELIRPYLPSEAVNVMTAGLGVMALLVYGPVAAVVLVAGSVGSQALVLHAREHARKNRELETEVASLKEALAGAGTTFGALMLEALGRKDGYTHHHAAATAVYAADIAREMRMDDARVEQIRLAGLLHNVGMISLPEQLLLQAGKPNSVARRELHEHPVLGERALAAIPGFEEMASWVRWHHERPDGRGYPDRLRGPWMPAEAKVLAVAQAYAAMVLDGPRRAAREPEEARRELVSGMEAAFDGVVVRAFLRVLDTGGEGYRRADDHRFVLPGSRAVRRAAAEGRGGT